MQAMQGSEDAFLARTAPVQPEKSLTLRIRPAAGHAHSQLVEFSVIDQGEGVSDEVAKQLFTPFFTTKPEGMGLGLSLCRTVIEQHGGFLGYESVTPQGTIFSFTLPVAATGKGDAAAQSALQEV